MKKILLCLLCLVLLLPACGAQDTPPQDMTEQTDSAYVEPTTFVRTLLNDFADGNTEYVLRLFDPSFSSEFWSPLLSADMLSERFSFIVYSSSKNDSVASVNLSVSNFDAAQLMKDLTAPDGTNINLFAPTSKNSEIHTHLQTVLAERLPHVDVSEENLTIHLVADGDSWQVEPSRETADMLLGGLLTWSDGEHLAYQDSLPDPIDPTALADLVLKNSGQLEDSVVTIEDVILQNDTNGSPILIVCYRWQNLVEIPRSAVDALLLTVTQDGIPLSVAQEVSPSLYKSGSKWDAIEKDVVHTVEIPYTLNTEQGEIRVCLQSMSVPDTGTPGTIVVIKDFTLL